MDPNTAALTIFLQKEFAKRCQANSRYSLRAYARSLGLEPSALSKLLKGKRRLSRKRFQALGEKLNLSPKELERLMPPEKLSRKLEQPISVSTYNELSESFAEIYADWYHFAILELTQVKGFKPEIKWIAKVLKISQAETQLAVNRLFASGFLTQNAKGRWLDSSGSVSVGSSFYTSAAVKRMQDQVLQRSAVALREIPIEKRDHSSMTMAIDSRKLPKAKELIKKFRRELCEVLKGDGPPRDQVYNLAISLYPVSEIDSN